MPAASRSSIHIREAVVIRDLIRWSTQGVIAAFGIVLLAAGADAGSFTRGCAARDMQVLMAIEAHESANNISAPRLDDAIWALMNARMVCHEGRVVDAMAMYNDIVQSLSADPILSSRMP